MCPPSGAQNCSLGERRQRAKSTRCSQPRFRAEHIAQSRVPRPGMTSAPQPHRRHSRSRDATHVTWTEYEVGPQTTCDSTGHRVVGRHRSCPPVARAQTPTAAEGKYSATHVRGQGGLWPRRSRPGRPENPREPVSQGFPAHARKPREPTFLAPPRCPGALDAPSFPARGADTPGATRLVSTAARTVPPATRIRDRAARSEEKQAAAPRPRVAASSQPWYVARAPAPPAPGERPRCRGAPAHTRRAHSRVGEPAASPRRWPSLLPLSTDRLHGCLTGP